jgi:hypothetical protein
LVWWRSSRKWVEKAEVLTVVLVRLFLVGSGKRGGSAIGS